MNSSEFPSPEVPKLNKHQDFIRAHSNERGEYDPKKGLEGILTTFTPDTKLVVLAAMNDRNGYFTNSQLYNQVRSWLDLIGVGSEHWPITLEPTWSYCELRVQGERIPGSLVDVGAVVKETALPTPSGYRTAYRRSEAGEELVVGLLPYVSDFVWKVARSDTPHKYKSMWELLGLTASTGKRHPLSVYYLIEFLTRNPGNHSRVDLEQALAGQVDITVISTTLAHLGETGMISYQSPTKFVAGKRGKGWAEFVLSDPNRLKNPTQVYKDIKSSINFNFTGRAYLEKVIKYIQANPDQVYEINNVTRALDPKIETAISQTSKVLNMLERIGILKRPTVFKSSEVLSQVSANDLTRMFYEMVLQPAKGVADSLEPPPTRLLDPQKIAFLLDNYKNERNYGGQTGGEAIRIELIKVLENSNLPLNLPHIMELFNQSSRRRVKPDALRAHLRTLIKDGKVARTQRGLYQLVGESK